MLISFDEVVTGALVNAIAVVGHQVSKAAAGLRKTDAGLATARWFETFRLTAAPPDLPGLSPSAAERLAEVLSGDEIQAALQQLLAVRLTDAPETDASRARDALQEALGAAAPGAAALGGALVGYYDDQICTLVARLEGEEPSLLAQIRSEAFSSRIISVLQAIERHSAVLAGGERPGAGGRAPGGPPAGRLLVEVTDPFDLEVHRAVQAGDAPPGLPVLPAYLPREHDRELARLARAAARGVSGIAVLVGGSSTGKTRSCWEALSALRDQDPPWRLWHPIDPSRPDAALRDLPAIGPRTVVWLNEAQLYLDVTAGGLGERVAAGLRQLLRDPARGPVLVLATLWPEFRNRLTARPPADQEDPHAQARELLTGRDITVPAAFTAAQVEQLAGSTDPRLALAAGAAEGGQVTQFLAGAPELMARYRNAPPAAAALIDAAIDARRLGMGVALPLAFLEAAAPGYLSDADWDGLSEGWLEQALGYTAAPANGIRGPLSRIRPRAAGGAVPVSGGAYRLADYLEQHGRRARQPHIPPADFWRAAARFAAPGDLPALIIESMLRAVPARQERLDEDQIAALRGLTSLLIDAKPGAAGEYRRFLGIKQRELCLPKADLAGRLRGATVLVTGGTGCIGSTLMAQLAAREPGRLISVSRGVTAGWPRQENAEYRYADVRDRRAIDELIAAVRPDLIFHVAAQRSPALAEVEVHRTVTTNVLGSRNVLAAAAAAGVPQVVVASTGKALRPYSAEMYTATKRAAEWVATTVAGRGDMLVSAARFTHVIDNSIVYQRLQGWAEDDGRGVVRLHSSTIAFYVQSALESAQLLLLALLGAERGEFRVHAITDLGWPVSLIDVAVGMLAHKGSRSPIYFSGYDPGYEEVPFPSLYDPATAWDVSPLLNAFETAAAVDSPCPMVDAFRLDMAPNLVAPKLLAALETVCERTEDADTVRHALDDLSWSVLDATLGAAARRALARSARLVVQHEHAMTPVHRRVMEAIKGHANAV